MDDIFGPIVQKRFGAELHHLSEFVTPDQVMVQSTFQEIAAVLPEDAAVLACWEFVHENVHYPMTFFGKPTDFHQMQALYTICSSVRLSLTNSTDFFKFPCETLGWLDQKGRMWGDCEDSSALLASLLLNFLPAEQVHVAIGYYEGIYAHAWVEVQHLGQPYILEATRKRPLPLSPWACLADNYPEYAPGCLFNHIDYQRLAP
jgi:hypothetical protein